MDAKPNRECPLCRGPNGCAPAATGSLSSPCWCAGATIPAEVLARVPEAQRGESCVCARCAAAPPSGPTTSAR